MAGRKLRNYCDDVRSKGKTERHCVKEKLEVKNVESSRKLDG